MADGWLDQTGAVVNTGVAWEAGGRLSGQEHRFLLPGVRRRVPRPLQPLFESSYPPGQRNPRIPEARRLLKLGTTHKACVTTRVGQNQRGTLHPARTPAQSPVLQEGQSETGTRLPLSKDTGLFVLRWPTTGSVLLSTTASSSSSLKCPTRPASSASGIKRGHIALTTQSSQSVPPVAPKMSHSLSRISRSTLGSLPQPERLVLMTPKEPGPLAAQFGRPCRLVSDGCLTAVGTEAHVTIAGQAVVLQMEKGGVAWEVARVRTHTHTHEDAHGTHKIQKSC